MENSSLHKFHIPVMGLAFTIDSPIKVARFGIASVISIVEDQLIEMMRSHYYPTIQLPYIPIPAGENDYRAKRITDYLNLVNTIVKQQVIKLRNASFEAGSEIVQYFEMLPDDSSVKKLYRKMTKEAPGTEKTALQNLLRTQVQAGSIDVNIMTKVDRENTDKPGTQMEDGSDAVAALRGYVQSDLTNSSIIFSAGMNPRLFNYLEKCPQFDADENGNFQKKVVVKVSDYRSALIQGKYLAKKGIWVSEFRIESGLNCGGHAFATEGYLIGPILEEFKSKRTDLVNSLFEIYKNSVTAKGKTTPSQPPTLKITVQGGIGTYDETQLLFQHYEVDGTGWGTPFLLVPEATTVDEPTLQLLSKARKEDVVLSHNSPLGVRFHYLKGTTSDIEKQQRILNGKPGSPCTEKHLAFNTEFTKDPICTASSKYQKLKIASLKSQNLPEEEYEEQVNRVLDKECLCIGLSNAAAIQYDKTMVKKLNAVTICPGPNIANFSKIVSLHTMTDHIYGRTNLVTNNERPHMFIAELNLYVSYIQGELVRDSISGQLDSKKKYYTSFYQNLKAGIEYYRELFNSDETISEQLDLATFKADKCFEWCLAPAMA